MAELETKPTKVRADGRRRDCITLLAKLGKHKTGKVCLSVKRLSDVDPEVLEELVTASVKHMKSVRKGRERIPPAVFSTSSWAPRVLCSCLPKETRWPKRRRKPLPGNPAPRS